MTYLYSLKSGLVYIFPGTETKSRASPWNTSKKCFFFSFAERTFLMAIVHLNKCTLARKRSQSVMCMLELRAALAAFPTCYFLLIDTIFIAPKFIRYLDCFFFSPREASSLLIRSQETKDFQGQLLWYFYHSEIWLTTSSHGSFIYCQMIIALRSKTWIVSTIASGLLTKTLPSLNGYLSGYIMS